MDDSEQLRSEVAALKVQLAARDKALTDIRDWCNETANKLGKEWADLNTTLPRAHPAAQPRIRERMARSSNELHTIVNHDMNILGWIERVLGPVKR